MLKSEGFKSLTIIEPSDVHYYQPLWTLVGGGLAKSSDSAKPMGSVLDKKTALLKAKVVSFQPDLNQVTLSNGDRVSYDVLVVAAGIQIDWHKIAGLAEALSSKSSGIASIYDAKSCENVWSNLQEFQGGRAIFTFPASVIKCTVLPLSLHTCEVSLVEVTYLHAFSQVQAHRKRSCGSSKKTCAHAGYETNQAWSFGPLEMPCSELRNMPRYL